MRAQNLYQREISNHLRWDAMSHDEQEGWWKAVGIYDPIGARERYYCCGLCAWQIIESAGRRLAHV